MSEEPVIACQGVAMTIGGEVPIPILAPTDLVISPGESVAVVGPSGAGKTTLASILGLLQRPSAGSYRFEGRETSGLSGSELAGLRSTSMGFVFQQANLVDERSAWRNVDLGLTQSRDSYRQREHRCRTALEKVGLERLAERRAAVLSGGERQRVSLARALVKNPRVIIADEPTGSLDQRTGQQILDLLFSLTADAVTLLVVTHDIRVTEYARRTVEVLDGHVRA